MPYKWVRWWLLLLLSVALPLCAAEPWQDPLYLQQAFFQVALKSEFGHSAAVVRKWQQPIKVWTVHHAEQVAAHDILTRTHLDHLAALTGLKIEMASTLQQANFMIVFSLAHRWRQDVAEVSGQSGLAPPPDAACMFGLVPNQRQAITRAWIVIPVDHASEQRVLLSCIVEEMTQAMGLPNDAEQVFPSIFNDKTPDTLLTGLDALLLKMLYHPSVKPGMREAQLRPIFTSVLMQWQQDGTIENIDKTVRASPLYDMMGY